MTEQIVNRYAAYPTERVLPFSGVQNFRDMGGYETADGRKVKYGILFRAAELTGLTEEDAAFLESLGIRTIFDYRGDDEAELKPDPAIKGAVYERIPAIPELQYRSHRDMESMLEQFDAGALDHMYGALPINNPSYKRLMQLLADPERLGLVHHCAAGKDRTGVGAALILSVLGVPWETIMEDYLMTNETLKGLHETVMSELAPKLTPEKLELVMRMMDAREEFLESAFRAIDEKYGSMEAYFEQEFGLTQQKIAAIRDYCLE
jgi:protein-tyrosine phosphatase